MILARRATGRVVFAGLVLALWAVPEPADGCPTGEPPAGLTPGVNDAKQGHVLFWLDVGRAKFGYRPNHLYKFDISSPELDVSFSNAILSIEEEDPSSGCGVGEFLYQPEDFFKYRDCDKVLYTNRKQSMTQLPPFTWKAPRCGCILVKATVIQNGEKYYMDEKNGNEGLLSKRFCPRNSRTKFASSSQQHKDIQTEVQKDVQTDAPKPTKPLPTPPPKRVQRKIQSMSRTDRMELLCHISVRYNGAELLAREVFLRRRDIFKLNRTSLIRLELALDQRRGDIHECCKRGSVPSKTQCFDDMRRRRIDRLCRNGHTDVPSIARRADFMKEKEQDCCWRMGERRYDCFNLNSRAVAEMGNRFIEYSLDEMDPVNDIGDYPSEIEELENSLQRDYFVDDSMYTTTPQPTTTSTTSTTTTTTTTRPPPSSITVPTTPIMRKMRSGMKRHLSGRDNVDLRNLDGVMAVAPGLIATTMRSTVEKKIEDMQRRAKKTGVKANCCQKGKNIAETMDRFDSVYSYCRAQARSYRKTVMSNKRLCTNQFMECCVDTVVQSSTQATNTEKSRPDKKNTKKSTHTPPVLSTQRSEVNRKSVEKDRVANSLLQQTQQTTTTPMSESTTPMARTTTKIVTSTSTIRSTPMERSTLPIRSSLSGMQKSSEDDDNDNDENVDNDNDDENDSDDDDDDDDDSRDGDGNDNERKVGRVKVIDLNPQSEKADSKEIDDDSRLNRRHLRNSRPVHKKRSRKRHRVNVKPKKLVSDSMEDSSESKSISKTNAKSKTRRHQRKSNRKRHRHSRRVMQ